MLRLAFLLLVVIGALALLVGLVAGIGLYQAARLQEPVATPVAAAANPVATHAQPAISPAPAATQPAAADAAVAIAKPAPAPPPVARVENGGEVVPPAAPHPEAVPPVILLAQDAVLIGEDVRLDAVREPVIVNWSNRNDGVEWTAQVPASGLYDVEFTYACNRLEGGGVFTIRAGPGYIAPSIRPTAGWDDYQTQYAGKLYLGRGASAVLIRPTYLQPGGKLMNLRSVKLTFVKEIAEPEFRESFRRRRGF